MENFYVKEGFTIEALNLQSKILNDQLREIGPLYDGTADFANLTTVQRNAQDLDNEGYSYADQIFDLYAEIGAVDAAREML